jgi:hypothetical protein
MEDLSRIYFHAKMISGDNVVELPREYWETVDVEPRKDLIYQDKIFD